MTFFCAYKHYKVQMVNESPASLDTVMRFEDVSLNICVMLKWILIKLH